MKEQLRKGVFIDFIEVQKYNTLMYVPLEFRRHNYIQIISNVDMEGDNGNEKNLPA